jgi:hypothetical protein
MRRLGGDAERKHQEGEKTETGAGSRAVHIAYSHQTSAAKRPMRLQCDDKSRLKAPVPPNQ